MALLKTDGNDPALLLRRADMAMYVAKTSGKNNVHFFSEEIDARVRGELALEAGLRQALTEERAGLVGGIPAAVVRTNPAVAGGGGAGALAAGRRTPGVTGRTYPDR